MLKTVSGFSSLKVSGALTVNSVIANGIVGSAGQVLTSNSSGSYWATVSSLGSVVNTAAQYTWSNTQTFQNTITFSSLVNTAAINVTGQVNTATLYATTSANIASAVQANATGVYTTGTVNAASLTVGTIFTANTTKVSIANGGVFEIPNTSVITSFVSDPGDSTNKVFAYRVFPTISYDPVALTNGDSVSPAVFSPILKASSNLTTGTIFGYGIFSALSTDATSSGGYQNHDLRGIYGNMYHYHNSNLIRMVGVAGRTYNRGTGTVGAAYSLWARNSTSTGGGAITDSHGIFVDDIAAGANNYGITSLVSSGSNKWNFYANGSAQNYFAGNVGIGNTTPAFKLRVDGTTSLAGAVSDITTLAAGNTTVTGFVNATSSVNTATFTVGTAFTANSTVVNAVAYYAGTLLVANSTVSNATHLGGTAASGYQTTAGLSSNVATLTANNAGYLSGTAANSYIKMNDLLQPFNPFIGSAGSSNTVKKTFNSIETNRFLGRGNLLYVTQDTVVNNTIASIITNGNFDESLTIAVAGGAATIININTVTNGLTGATGFTYASGAVWVMFYPGLHPSALTCRTKDNVGTWTAATVTQEIFYSGSCIGWKCVVGTGNYITDIELTITPQASVGNLGLAEIEYHGSRMGISEGPLLSVAGGTLYGSSKYYSNLTVNATISSTLLQVSNSTSTANLTAADLKIGATTVVNSTQITATLAVANLSGSYANITGQVNTATLYAATSANIASAVQANATGVYTTGTVNAASFTTTGVTANVTGIYPTSNSSGTALGSATQRWVINANTINISGATASGNATSGALVVSGGIGVANNVYVAGRFGFSNASNISVAYSYYNVTTNSIDTVFGI